MFDVSLVSAFMTTVAASQFQPRYFRWGLTSFANELACDFARLKTTNSSTVFRLISTMRSLPSEGRMEFGRALIKKRRLLEIDASEIDGEALSPREVAICREFLDDFALRRTDRELEL